MAGSQLSRMLKLINLVRGRVARNVKQLARELEVTQRTVHRDLNVLQSAGMPCHFDKEAGGYRMTGDVFLPPMQLTLTEALALSVLGAELAQKGQVPFLRDAWRAVTKIRSQLPAAVGDDLANLDGTVKVHTARISPVDTTAEQYFETLRKAIADKRKVRCTYARGNKDGDGAADHGPFLFRPYALYFGQRAWYVIGHSEKSGGERTLKLSRLKSVQPTDRPYGIPDGWTTEKCFGKAWRMIRGERRYMARIRFDAEHAMTVAETLWHPTQTIEWESDGSCIFRCEVDGLDEIVWWVLGHGWHAEILAPVELRDLVCRAIESMAERCRIRSRSVGPQQTPLSAHATQIRVGIDDRSFA